MTGQAIALGYNPKIFFAGVGTAMANPYKQMFGGPQAIEGVMGPGGWNAKTSPGAAEFIDRYVARTGSEPDYWGQLLYYSSLEVLQQAIEKTGTLNQKPIRDLIASATFDTSMGPMRFVGGFNTNHPGEISQWQNGIFEVIGPASKRTAPPLYPKPPWPAPSQP
jgi:branched-chain amino acid transport system substrate-binding protein